MNSVLSSILGSRIFYNWRMAKRGAGYAAGSLIAAAGAGAFAGIAHNKPEMAAVGLSPPLGLAGFLVFVAVSAFLWWRFSTLQDEMFQRVQNYSYGWGAAVTVAVLVVWGVANAAALAPAIAPLAPLFIFAIAKTFFWSLAVRRWL